MANRKSWKTGHHWILLGQSGGISMVARSPLYTSSGLPESGAQSKHLPRDPFSLPGKRSFTSWTKEIRFVVSAIGRTLLHCYGYPPTAATPIDVELARALLHATRDAQTMNVCEPIGALDRGPQRALPAAGKVAPIQIRNRVAEYSIPAVQQWEADELPRVCVTARTSPLHRWDE